MNYTNKATGGANLYNQVAVHTGVGTASPHKLIQMLLDAGLEKIAAAKGFVQRGDIENRGKQIGHAISIIEGLRVSLDEEKGGEMATNLHDLYLYMEKRLFEANLANDSDILNEVSGLLGQIKFAWDAISDEVHQGTSANTQPGQLEREMG
jgi:flagellar protein FliS